MEPTPIETVKAWFDAFASGDLERARTLFAADGIVRVAGDEASEIRGFDEFVGWYARRRRALGESFGYRVDDVLDGGSSHAAALITLSRTVDGRRIEWRQVAVYRVVDGVITEIHADEEPQDRSGSWAPAAGDSRPA